MSTTSPWLARLQRALSDEFMALLALLTGLATAAHYAFDLPPNWQTALEFGEALIITIFAVEYLVGLRLAAKKAAYIRNPWRILDALIIGAALISMLPMAADALGASPVLRLIRLARVAVLGTRTGVRLSSQSESSRLDDAREGGPLEAYALHANDPAGFFKPVAWQEAIERIGSAQDDWLLFSGVRQEHLIDVARELDVPERVLANRLFEAAFPRLDRLDHFATLFTWYPRLVDEGTGANDIKITRTGLLLVGSAQNVAVLVREATDLLPRLEARMADAETSMPVLVQATFALLKEVVRAYQRVVEHLETTLIDIETEEGVLRDREFLARTFRLRTDITRVRTTLRHLTNVVRNMNSRRVAIAGFDVALPSFQLLSGEVADLFERVDDLHTNLAALVEMRLNVSSFQMNKVMRLLAILTTLALIPAVVGGMLGMNLTDTPWPATLPQVAFWVGSGMLVSMYLFAIKGWLR